MVDQREQSKPLHRFDPNDHMRQIKSREGSQDYLDVKWRLVWFRENCPQGTIDSEEIVVDLDRECEVEAYQWNNDTRRSEKVVKRAKGYARFKAIVCDGKGGRATAHGSECAADFSEFIEKAETKAVGRALAMLGFGTAFAPELNEEDRIVDAPVDRSHNNPATSNDRKPSATVRTATASTPTTTPKNDAESTLATDQQISSLRKLRQHLGKPEMDADLEKKMTHLEAKEAIASLSREYNEQKQNRKAS